MNPNRNYTPRAGTPERPLTRAAKRELARNGSLIIPDYMFRLTNETLESKRHAMNRHLINLGHNSN
jgi:hypothetical protein